MATDRPFASASDQEDDGDDECHHDVVDPEGASNPVCWKCGETNPDEETE